MLFWRGEINGSRRYLRCIFPRGLSDCECLVSLQRPVQWTMAAVIAHVMIQWQESAAAVLLASLCSLTARPVKVKHHHSNGSCYQINLQLVVLPVTLELLSPPGAHRNYYQAIYAAPTLPVSTFPNLLVVFSLYILHFHCLTPTRALTMSASLLVPPILHSFLFFQLHILSIILWFHQFSWQFLHHVAIILLSEFCQSILNWSNLNAAAFFIYYV